MAKTQARWAQACKAAVELIGRVNRGADLACEIAEALASFPESPTFEPPTVTERFIAWCPHCLTYGTPMLYVSDESCGNCGKTGLRFYVECQPVRSA